MRVEYRYVAVKPIRAEHPVGSGIIVSYDPQQEVPAGEWGRAADNLCEMGKLVRVGVNVPEDGDEEGQAWQPQVAMPGLSDPTHAYRALEGQQPRIVEADSAEEPAAEADAEEPVLVLEETVYPRVLGAGYYELSDGTRVRGKKKAAVAQEALTASMEEAPADGEPEQEAPATDSEPVEEPVGDSVEEPAAEPEAEPSAE